MVHKPPCASDPDLPSPPLNSPALRCTLTQPELESLQLHILLARLHPLLVGPPGAVVLGAVGGGGGLCLPLPHLLQQGGILGLVHVTPDQLQRAHRLQSGAGRGSGRGGMNREQLL
jgi:hypothetical protein